MKYFGAVISERMRIRITSDTSADADNGSKEAVFRLCGNEDKQPGFTLPCDLPDRSGVQTGNKKMRKFFSMNGLVIFLIDR